MKTESHSPPHWLNIVFLVSLHVAAVGGLIAYGTLHGVTWAAVAIGISAILLTSFAISAGYHRLFAHRTYETGPVFRFVLLILGAAAFQNSALNWAADHRRHHRHVDTPLDPYNAKRGFWYSHIGWVLVKTPDGPVQMPAPDLEADPLVRWQHKYYLPLGIVSGFLLPWFIGFLAGDPWGGLLLGGAVRLLITYHMTFSINSLAHWLGDQPYSQRNSSRDGWFAALLTMGEGYHNYHHTFPSDYRNGVEFHHFDPPKWVLYAMERVGLTRKLKRTPALAIARACVRADQRRMDERVISRIWREKLQLAQQALNATLSKWNTLAAQKRSEQAKGNAKRRLELELRLARRSFRRSYRSWRQLVRQVELENGPLSASSAH